MTKADIEAKAAKEKKEISFQIDSSKIEKAREEFKKKDFNQSLEIYKSVGNRDLLEELDKSIIKFCEQHLKSEKR